MSQYSVTEKYPDVAKEVENVGKAQSQQIMDNLE